MTKYWLPSSNTVFRKLQKYHRVQNLLHLGFPYEYTGREAKDT